MRFEFELPIQTKNITNQRVHWAVKAGEAKSQKRWVRLKFPHDHLRPLVRVTMTRVSAGTMDDDGLRAALKGIRDGIAIRLGVNDGGPLVRWEYAQEKGPIGKHLVRVRVELLEAA